MRLRATTFAIAKWKGDNYIWRAIVKSILLLSRFCKNSQFERTQENIFESNKPRLENS